MGHSVHPRFCGQPPGSSVFLDDVCKGCKGAVLSLLGRSHLHHRPVRQTFLWNKPSQAHRLSDELLLFKIHVSVVIKPSQGNKPSPGTPSAAWGTAGGLVTSQ